MIPWTFFFPSFFFVFFYLAFYSFCAVLCSAEKHLSRRGVQCGVLTSSSGGTV